MRMLKIRRLGSVDPAIITIGALVIIAIGLLAWGLPQYGVYHQHTAGRAQLAKAEYSKQILVQDAMAREAAAKSLAQAEVIRAEGVAKANRIIGESLANNEAYLRYLWIHNLESGNHDVVYVPTEAQLPILEAGARHKTEFRPRPQSGDPGTPEHPDVSADD